MIVNCGSQDGYGFEREAFGIASPDVDERLRSERVRSFTEAIQKVMRCQHFLDWNPRKPKTPLIQSLFRRVAHGLRDHRDLRFYISVGTWLDPMGVDCFFEHQDRVVTIDLTVRPFKHDLRADFLLSRLDFVLDCHYQLADRMAKKLSRRQKLVA
jgi:hypothetical protein